MLLIPLWEAPEDKTPPPWRLYSIADDNKECPIVASLILLLKDAKYAAHAEALVALISTLCWHERGPKLYHGNLAVCHESVYGEQIFGFRKGPLRLHWFYGVDKQVVICSTLEVKCTAKTPKKVAKKLIAARDAYHAAHLAQILSEKL